MKKDEELRAEGWTRRTILSEPRLSEVKILYEKLGFEVLLKELDEVLELGFPEGGNRYDGNKPFPHPHLICMKCKKILDPDLFHLKDVTEELVQETGFKIVSHRLDFFGICPECLLNENHG